MEAETVFVLAIFAVFFVVGASLFYYACCVTDNEEAVKKLRESLKRRRSRGSLKVSMATSSQTSQPNAVTSHVVPIVTEVHSVGVQVAPPTPEVFQPPPEFSEGSSSSITPTMRTPTPEPKEEDPEEHRNSIDCSNHSNVLSVLLQEYLDSLAKAKDNAQPSAVCGRASNTVGNRPNGTNGRCIISPPVSSGASFGPGAGSAAVLQAGAAGTTTSTSSSPSLSSAFTAAGNSTTGPPVASGRASRAYAVIAAATAGESPRFVHL